MSNEPPMGLPANIDALGRAITTMMPPLHNKSDYDQERSDSLIKGHERISVQVERLQIDIEKILLKVERLETANVSRQEYEQMKERTEKNTSQIQTHHVWLLILTIGGCLIGSGLLYLFVYVFNGGL